MSFSIEKSFSRKLVQFSAENAKMVSVDGNTWDFPQRTGSRNVRQFQH